MDQPRSLLSMAGLIPPDPPPGQHTCKQITDYSDVLKTHHLTYKPSGYYLQVGEIPAIQGWIIHLSVIRAQLAALLEVILPVLAALKLPFKIIRDAGTAGYLLDGNLGVTQLGKIICIYTENDIQAKALASRLVHVTAHFRGPVIPTDAYLGNIVYVCYGPYSPEQDSAVPFALPAGVTWPFGGLPVSLLNESKGVLNRIYKPVEVLKSDTRGMVAKCVDLTRLFRRKVCLIKEGKSNMWADDEGRDIRDRLLWQRELHDDLAGYVPLPRILDCFNKNGDVYLVMEFIHGDSLETLIALLHNGNSWLSLPVSTRDTLLDYLLQILNIVERLHHRGYIHRDIAPSNFLVDGNNQVFLADMELAYCQLKSKPEPPFRLGTTGFMSPEQLAVQTPTVKEDIYGLGALMVMLFTGLPPVKFNMKHPDLLREHLYFLTGDQSLAAMIAACLNHNPLARPSLAAIEGKLTEYKHHYKKEATQAFVAAKRERPSTALISTALLGLTHSSMMTADQRWVSRRLQQKSATDTRQVGLSYCGNLHDGMAGVQYLLARAVKTGFSIDNCLPAYIESSRFIKRQYLDKLHDMPAGLFEGLAGIALAISEGISAGIQEANEENTAAIRQCLSLAPVGLDIANGISGHGMALLRCAPLLDHQLLQHLLQRDVRILLSQQQKDGSWLLPSALHQRRSEKLTGFAYGVAGITWFLLVYASRCQDPEALKAAANALHWLIRQAKKSAAINWWLMSPTNKLTDPWSVAYGVPGIALTFIKAYEITQQLLYQQVAESALRFLPPQPLISDFTQSYGLAGIGEVYLEASRVFKKEEWIQRADWIAWLFASTFQQGDVDGGYWITDDGYSPTASLMTGNSGIIHFLMRYNAPGVLGCPLLSE